MVDGEEILRVDPGPGGFWDFGDFDRKQGYNNPWQGASRMAPFDQEVRFAPFDQAVRFHSSGAAYESHVCVCVCVCVCTNGTPPGLSDLTSLLVSLDVKLYLSLIHI